MPIDAIIARLKANLLTSGLQEKDQPLFQVINQLIDYVGVNSQDITLVAASTSGGGGGGGVTAVADDGIYVQCTPDPIITTGTVDVTVLSKSAIDGALHQMCGGI